MRDAVGQIRSGITESQEECERFKVEHDDQMDDVLESGEAMVENLDKYRVEGEEMSTSGAKVRILVSIVQFWFR